MQSRDAIGRHVLADLHGIPVTSLRDRGLLLATLREALTREGFHILRQVSHSFPGEIAGATGVFLLGESHAAFHSYPEFEYLSVDIFSCGSADPAAAVAYVEAVLRPSRVHLSSHDRGLLPHFHRAAVHESPDG
ncbi:MAG TPA: adenosylmethionine decarboxylase [Longimicrobium sp.]|nr:adenosylmethionine decarboxylase [Longimicrobium sp.]